MRGIHGGDIYSNQIALDFSVNVNPLGMPESVRTALEEAALCCQAYPDPEVLELGGAVSEWLSVPGKWLLFGNGASELFLAIVHGVKPKKVLIPTPSFYGYAYAARGGGAEILYFPMKKQPKDMGEIWTLDLTSLKPVLQDVDLVFLASPNNPTGDVLPRETLLTILNFCKEKNIPVVLDQCFLEFCTGEGEQKEDVHFQKQLVTELGTYDNLLLVRAFTKSFAIPGVRLGYLVCSNPKWRELVKAQLPEWNLSTFAQKAGVACVKEAQRTGINREKENQKSESGGGTEVPQKPNYLEVTRELVATERCFLEQGLVQLGIKVFPSETNFLLVYTERPLYELLLQRGILIRDCSNFRGLEKGYYRIAVRKRKDNEKLLKVIGECIAQNRTYTSGRN